MCLINTVWSLVNQVMNNSRSVTIDEGAIAAVATDIKLNTIFRCLTGCPECIDPSDPKALNKLFLYEIIANSVNYCYWYGKHNIRPNGSDSTKMYKLLDESFEVMNKLRQVSMYHPHHELEIIIGAFIDKLSKERFPLLDHRVRHLNEILNRSDLLSVIDICVQNRDYSVDKWLEYLVFAFPGYGKDLFLKRAFLFIIEMYRRCRLFEKEIDRVPVPADYQIPKVLRMLGCIHYHYPLDLMVKDGRLIPEGSLLECEIRAATLVVCRRIANLAECSCADVDTYFFNKRHGCKDPFHLTVTSNY